MADAVKKVPGIKIVARRDGYRRCGMAHSANGAEHATSKFSAAQLKTLREDAGLIVTDVEVDAPAKS
mgnify:CR=1 FL=1